MVNYCSLTKNIRIFVSNPYNGRVTLLIKLFSGHVVMTKKKLTPCIFIALLLLSAAPGLCQLENVIGLTGLAVSPDGSSLAFSYLGDIWTVPVDGGRARRLTVHPASDRSPIFSPDGQYIAFSSNRFGSMDVFLMEAFGGEPQRLTYHSSNDMVTQFAPSGNYIIFNSYRDYREHVTWKVPVNGGEPSILCPLESVHGKLSSDETMFVYQKGFSGGYRRGYKGPGASNLWLMDINTYQTRTLTETDWIDRNPEWHPDGRSIVYISETNGVQNVYRMNLETQTITDVTQLAEGLLTDMVVAPNGDRVYFCIDAEAYYTDSEGTIHTIPITAPADRTSDTTEQISFSTCGDFAVSPDNKQIVIEHRGDLFAISPEGGKTRALTETPWRESNPEWHPDNGALYYLGDRTGKSELYKLTPDDDDRTLYYRARFFNETTVFENDVPITRFSIAPNGEFIIYVQADGAVYQRDIDGYNPERLLDNMHIYSIDFSPDSRWITYLREFGGLHLDTFLFNLETKQEYQVSRLYGRNIDTRFSEDGKQLLVVSGDVCSFDIYAVWLSRLDHERYEDEDYDDRETDDSSEDTNEDTSNETTIDLPGIHERFRCLVSWHADTQLPWITRDGKTLVFKSNAMGSTHVYAMDIKGNSVEKPRTLAEINPAAFVESSDGGSLFYRTDSNIGKLDIEAGRTTPITIDGTMQLDRIGEFLQMYNEAWSTIKYGFYDPDLHGVDWDAAYERYLPLFERTRTAWEFRDAVQRLIGELNASHLGISGGDDPGLPSVQTGWLGLRLGEFVEGRGYTIRDVVDGTPADRKASAIYPGEYLKAINRVNLTPEKPMATLLNNMVDEWVELEIVNTDKRINNRKVSLKPMSSWQYHTAAYRHWVAQNRQMVDRLSDGTIGYLHIRSMNHSSLEQFRNDVFGLHWDKDALIIDVRGNPGGYIHNDLLRHLTGDSFGVSIPRLGEPKDHPDYVWRKPSVVVMDERSFSDAEVFPNGYQTLGIGKVIGMPTFGGVIGTGGIRLLNNAWFRLPRVGWFTADGRNMENTGAIPDIFVEREPGEELEDRDSQLERAVTELLAELGILGIQGR
jgi:tricorn protease